MTKAIRKFLAPSFKRISPEQPVKWTCEYCGKTQHIQGACLGCQASPPATLSEGLLVLNGITKEQWEQALADRQSQLNTKQQHHFTDIMLLSGPSLVTRAETRNLLATTGAIPRGWTVDRVTHPGIKAEEFEHPKA